MFKSKRKTFVASFGSSVHEYIPDVARISINESIIYNSSMGMTLVDNLVFGINSNMRRALNYAEDKYFYGLPQGTVTSTGLDHSKIQTYLNNLESTTVDVRDIYMDFESANIELFEFMYKTHGWDGFNLLRKPTGNVKNAVNEVNYEAKTDWINDETQKVKDEYTYTTVENGVTTESTCWVLHRNTIINDEYDSAYFSDFEQIPEVVGSSHWRTKHRMYDDGFSNTQLSYERYRITYGVKTIIEADAVFRVNQQLKITTPTYNEDTEEWVDVITFELNNFDVNKEIYREIEREDIIEEEVDITISPEIKILVFYKANNEYKMIDGSNLDFIGDQEINLEGRFYPVINLRDDNRDPTRDEMRGLDQYKTSKKLCKILGTNYDKLVESINENPEINEIDFAHFVMGVPVSTESQEGIEYLHTFFKDMADVSPHNKTQAETFEAAREAQEAARAANARRDDGYEFRINRGFQTNIIELWDKQYRTRLIYDYIHIETVYNIIGKVGTCTKEIITTDEKSKLVTANYLVTKFENYNEDFLILRKQISETQIEKVTIKSLMHLNFAYRDHTVLTHLSDIGDEEKEGNFIIPLYEPSVKKLSPIKRDALHYESQQVVVNTYVTIKIKWYQQSWFSFVVMAIAIWYFGPILGAKLSIAVAKGTMAVLKLVAQMVLTRILISYVFRLVVKAIGTEAALLLAIAVTVYTMGKGLQLGSFKDIPFADELVMAATGLTEGVGYNINEQMKQLTGESDAFLKDMKEKMDELNEINKELDFQKFLDPMWFTDIRPALIFGETPDFYFSRTLAPNPGIQTFDIIENYVDIMLKLPELKDSIPEEEDYE